MFDRIATPIIAVGLAFLVWLYIRSRDQEFMEKNVPVVFRLSPNQRDMFEIVGEEKTDVPVTFTGPPSRIRELRSMFQRGEVTLMRTITVPEKEMAADRYDYKDRYESSQLNVPPGVRVDIPANRRDFSVSMRRLIKKSMKVQVRFLGDGDRVLNVQTVPSQVEVYGPQEILMREEMLPTLPVAVPENNSDKEETVTRVAELPKRFLDTPIEVNPPIVNVTFAVKPAQGTYEITDVPVHWLIPAGFPFTPQFTNQRAGTISLTVRGPAQRPTGIKAYVDLTAKQYSEAGLQSEEPIKVELPKGYELVGRPPRLSSFQLAPGTPPVKAPS